jgi:hypothetical protein
MQLAQQTPAHVIQVRHLDFHGAEVASVCLRSEDAVATLTKFGRQPFRISWQMEHIAVLTLIFINT